MIRLLTFLLFSAISFAFLLGQPNYFTGRIDFQNTFASTNPDLPVTWVKAAMGESASLYLYPGGYVEHSDSKLGWEKQWFRRDEGRIYFKQTGIDTLYWMDTTQRHDTLLEVRLEDETEEVLGRTCKVLMARTNKGSNRYFFDPQLHLPADFYDNLKMGHKDKFHPQMQSPYLKLDMERNGISTVLTAVKIERMKKIKKKITRLPRKLPRREWIR